MFRYFLVVVPLITPTVATAQTFGDLGALTIRQDREAHRVSSSAEDLASNGDAVTILPGKSITLLDADGPGILTHFWNTIAALDPFHGRSVVIRIYYDGNEKPSVVAPLGDFFGVGHGAEKSFTSAPVAVSSHGLARTCYWQIPFNKHVKVTVSNESPVYPVASFYYYLNWHKLDKLPKNTVYFHAQYRQSMPAPPGHYTILDTKGRGHYAGTVYSAHQVELGWFGEGDDFIYIDGAEMPQLKGTGTEDYFNDAWGFREFDTPYHGVTMYEGVFPTDRVTAYRWHVADPIPFDESIRVTIEHRGSAFDESAEKLEDMQIASSNERPDWVSSVAFWYQDPPAQLDDALPPANERIAPYRIYSAADLTHRADPPERVGPSHVGINYLVKGEEAAIEFDFEADKPGQYRIRGLFEHSIFGAIWQPYLDGKPIGGPIDMVVPDSHRIWDDLDLHTLEAGIHTLRFEMVPARSPAQRSITFPEKKFTVEYFTLLRLEDMAGHRALLKKHRQ